MGGKAKDGAGDWQFNCEAQMAADDASSPLTSRKPFVMLKATQHKTIYGTK
jgi:hypothetical protein